MTQFLERIWKTLISLKLAVLVIASLAVCLMVATVLESKYDSKTAQYLVYRAFWFYGILTLLGLNILAVAISRYPWKKRQIPFLMAHAGILMILIGAWLTYEKGLDGSLRVSEGEVTSAIELDSHVMVFSKKSDVISYPFPWMPSFAADHFKPVEYPDFHVKVEKFISDAESKVNFIPADPGTPEAAKASPAILIRVLGSPMGGAPELWLWSGDAAWSTQKMGPARFVLRQENQKDLAATRMELNSGPEARLDFIVNKKGELSFEATSIRGEKKKGKLVLSPGEPTVVNPGWRMPIKVQVKKIVLAAVNHSEFVPLRIKPEGMGSALPNPAVQITLTHNPAEKIWLGLGDRAEFNDVDGTSISVGYFPKRVILPFAVRLKQFELKHNPGTMDPSAYSSYVQVVDQLQKNTQDMDSLPVQHITMNEPMEAAGYTFYQASYLPDFPRPTTTVLSVNYDPGRSLKYSGSLLLILGAVLLYLVKAKESKKKKIQEQV